MEGYLLRDRLEVCSLTFLQMLRRESTLNTAMKVILPPSFAVPECYSGLLGRERQAAQKHQMHVLQLLHKPI